MHDGVPPLNRYELGKDQHRLLPVVMLQIGFFLHLPLYWQSFRALRLSEILPATTQ